MSEKPQPPPHQRDGPSSRSQQTSVGAIASSSGGGRGLTNSGPIVRIGAGGPLPTNTPPLVKSKLAFNPASTRVPPPMGPPPMMSKTPVQSTHIANFDPYATNNNPVQDHALQTRTPGGSDPVVVARQSPVVAPGTKNSSLSVPLPPPQQTASHPLHPLDITANSVQEATNAAHYQQPQHQQSSQQQRATVPLSQVVNSQHSTSTPRIPAQPKPKQVRPPSTPDEEIDAFLRGDSNDRNQLNPSPLPSTSSILEKARVLASRRAYADIIRVTNEALIVRNMDKNTGAGAHHAFYSEIVGAARSNPGSNPPTPCGGSLDPRTAEGLRRETCELIALRLVSQQKLRRFTELSKEVALLGLLPHLPDHPESLPSLIDESPAIAPSMTDDGTVVTSDSKSMQIDVISSEVADHLETQEAYPMAWKEGSLHSSATSDKLPSWVPFGLRLLAVEQLQHSEGHDRTIDVLFDVRDRSVRTDYWGSQGMDMWTFSVDNLLANAAMRKGDWRLALRSLENICQAIDSNEVVRREVDYWCGSDNVGEHERSMMVEIVKESVRVEIVSRQLRVLLQCGAINAAEQVQNAVRSSANRVQELMSRAQTFDDATARNASARMCTEYALVRQVPSRRGLNDGLLAFSLTKYDDAAKNFRESLNQQRSLPGNASLPCLTWKELSSPTLGFNSESSLTIECLNNLSLCLLYSGNMRAAVNELEGLVRADPTQYLTEGIAFNLCTLYELGSDGQECTRKKKLLQRLAKRFFLHDVEKESFRLG